MRWETPSGLMNSIGLQNPGIPHFIEHELPQMLKLKPVTIANLSGSDLDSYIEGAKLLEKSSVPVIELNISCPNVSAGGASFGMSCSSAGTVVSKVREIVKKPLWVKLTPQSPELNQVALSCIEAGADAISLCNSFQGVAIDIETGRPVFDKIKAVQWVVHVLMQLVILRYLLMRLSGICQTWNFTSSYFEVAFGK